VLVEGLIQSVDVSAAVLDQYALSGLAHDVGAAGRPPAQLRQQELTRAVNQTAAQKQRDLRLNEPVLEDTINHAGHAR
jgi:hypothetical protein